MTLRCRKCGGPATAGKVHWEEGHGQCLGCGSIASLEIPASQERRAPVPDDMVQGPAWPMTGEAGTGGQLWLHQAESLGALERGENVVVAIATASGTRVAGRDKVLGGHARGRAGAGH